MKKIGLILLISFTLNASAVDQRSTEVLAVDENHSDFSYLLDKPASRSSFPFAQCVMACFNGFRICTRSGGGPESCVNELEYCMDECYQL